jgi:hypothetical protein
MVLPHAYANHGRPPHVRADHPRARASCVHCPHCAGPGPSARTLKGHHLLCATGTCVRRAAGPALPGCCPTGAPTKKGRPRRRPLDKTCPCSVHSRHILTRQTTRGPHPRRGRGCVSPREKRPGHHAHTALLSSCYVISYLSPPAAHLLSVSWCISSICDPRLPERLTACFQARVGDRRGHFLSRHRSCQQDDAPQGPQQGATAAPRGEASPAAIHTPPTTYPLSPIEHLSSPSL